MGEAGSLVYYIGLAREIIGICVFFVCLYPIFSGRDNYDPEDENETSQETPAEASPENVGYVETHEWTHIQQTIHTDAVSPGDLPPTN